MGRNCFYELILVICSIFTLVHATIANSEIFHGFKIPCRNTSPQCLKQALQSIVPEFTRGIPELDVLPLDPFVVNNLTVGLPGGLDINFQQSYTKGLRKSIIDSVRNTADENYEVILHCNLITKSKYRTSGKVLMFEIDGDGDSTVSCRNLKIQATFKINFITKEDGQQYAQIENFKASHAFDGRVTYNMSNLSKGNPDLSKIILDFMNQNWLMIANEFGSPFIDYAMNIILSNTKKVLDAVPLNNLFSQ